MQKESFPSERFGAPCSLLDPACDPENPVVVTGERVLGKLWHFKGVLSPEIEKKTFLGD